MPFWLNVSNTPGAHPGASSCSLIVGAPGFAPCADPISETVTTIAVNEVTAKSQRMICPIDFIARISTIPFCRSLNCDCGCSAVE